MKQSVQIQIFQFSTKTFSFFCVSLPRARLIHQLFHLWIFLLSSHLHLLLTNSSRGTFAVESSLSHRSNIKMNALRNSFATFSKTFGRRQTKAQSTIAATPSHIPVSVKWVSTHPWRQLISWSCGWHRHFPLFSFVRVQKIYHKSSKRAGVHKALFNVSDPRTFPRYAVALTAATFFSVASANTFWYKHHHFDTEHKNDPMAPTHNERPVQMVRTLSTGPIAFNAKRYETLRHQGLGIDKDQWMEEKNARDAKRT